MTVNHRLVTSYATTSAQAADANQARIEAVFAELAETKPDDVSYVVLRLADGSFVHVSFHAHGPEQENPIAGSLAFAEFLGKHGEIREGGVNQQEATLVGAYLTEIS